MAKSLDNILAVSIQNYSQDAYRSEIWDGSEKIKALNWEFKHIAPRLDVLSYYETMQTSTGRSAAMILEQRFAVIGWPGETPIPLNADHNTVCKFDSTHDLNYIHVKNGLKTLMKKVRSKGPYSLSTKGRAGIEQLENLLAIPDNHRDDLQFFHKRWTPGTCGWILSNPLYEDWSDEDKGTAMLWLHALPASGKSVLSSYVTYHLQEESLCVYYFFRFTDQTKRSLSTCLRVLAFQIAERLPQFRRALQELKFSAKSFEKADARVIWEKVFIEVLFRMRFNSSQFWIIDALDEADHPRLLVELMQDVSRSLTPIKILLVSRQTPELISTFERLSLVVPVVYLPIEDTKRDISNFLTNEVKYMHASREVKSQIVERLIAGADGNFLWARLAFDEVKECNTQEDLEEILEGLPTGMEKFYRRMEQTLTDSLEKKPRTRN